MAAGTQNSEQGSFISLAGLTEFFDGLKTWLNAHYVSKDSEEWQAFQAYLTSNSNSEPGE